MVEAHDFPTIQANIDARRGITTEKKKSMFKKQALPPPSHDPSHHAPSSRTLPRVTPTTSNQTSHINWPPFISRNQIGFDCQMLSFGTVVLSRKTPGSWLHARLTPFPSNQLCIICIRPASIRSKALAPGLLLVVGVPPWERIISKHSSPPSPFHAVLSRSARDERHLRRWASPNGRSSSDRIYISYT